MAYFLTSTVLFIIWGFSTLLLYMNENTSHLGLISGASGYSAYLFVLLLFYGGYKTWQLYTKKKETSFGFWHIVGYFLLHLLVLCFIYAAATYNPGNIFLSQSGGAGITLFFHCLELLLYPFLLVFVWRALGYTLLQYSPSWKTFPLRLRVPAETALGLGIFSMGLLVLGALGYYTLTGLLCLTGFLGIISIAGWYETYKNIRKTQVVFCQSQDKKGALQYFNGEILSAEIAFLIVTFVMCVALISVIRPMPIGWDDLGVYMNFPKIMAHTGEYLLGAGMYTWQLITGTGYLWNNIAAQAFYINQIGGILSTLGIICAFSLLFETKNTKKYLCLPMLLGIIYYCMPMTVFHQAKDMKVDPALMFVSVAAIMVLWKSIQALREKQDSQKSALSLLALSGILIGIAFSIKFTTLILIIAALGYISAAFLGFFGFSGFFFLFCAAFTSLHLWGKMFVWMPENVTGISLVLAVVGGISFLIACSIHSKKEIRTWMSAFLIFSIGILAGVAPWLIKNGSESQFFHTKNIDGLLIGSGGIFQVDHSTLYPPEEYKNRVEKLKEIAITGSGQSLNEDLSRYFGQEKGMNNYLKLPFNLTIQKNQKGEFTDITYIFLALLPVMMLFLASKRKFLLTIFVSLLLIFYYLYAIFPLHITENKSIQASVASLSSHEEVEAFRNGSLFGNMFLGKMLFVTTTEPINTQREGPSKFCIPAKGDEASATQSFLCPRADIFFGKIFLPEGYGILLILFFLFLIIAELTIREKNIKLWCYFSACYGFLFLISSFGIVWYGVCIYFFMLILIGYGAHVCNEKDPAEKNEEVQAIKGIVIGFFAFFILFYHVGGTFPHVWKNFISSGINEYKYGKMGQEEGIFAYQGNYITALSVLNLKNPQEAVRAAGKKAETSFVKNIFSDENLKNLSADDMRSILLQLWMNMLQIPENTPQKTISLPERNAVLEDIHTIGNALYSNILYPSAQEENLKKIYRVGTFMTYLINKNRERYYEDNLLFDFDTYFYENDPDNTVEYMKKVGIGYLLIDLNAATIDRDPRHALTTRHEHLLSTLRSKKLTLIDTDNLCLRFALDSFHAGKIPDLDTYIKIGGTNYESYKKVDGKDVQIPRYEKQNACANAIMAAWHENENLDKTYPYLGPLIAEMKQAKTEKEFQRIFQKFLGQSWFGLFEINENDTEIPAPSTEISSGALQVNVPNMSGPQSAS